MEKQKITTSSGFSCVVAPEALNDMEIIDCLVEAQEGDLTAWTKVIKKMFSPEEKKRLYDHIRDESGRVPPEKLMQEIGEIFQNDSLKK